MADGADHLPITDDEMTRFWITLRQGVNFVLSCLGMMHGGEIFVPKIPSMKISEVARSIAPELPQKIVGIRPGEKLHEVMISEDDSRMTVDLEDRYVIEPAFAWWPRETYRKNGAKPVTEGFRFSSDTNPQWLEAVHLKKMMQDSGLETRGLPYSRQPIKGDDIAAVAEVLQ